MNINEFMKTNEYPDFIKENSGNGKLKIRAYAASEALPVDGLNIIVSSVINNEEVVFFKGVTDNYLNILLKEGEFNSIKKVVLTSDNICK